MEIDKRTTNRSRLFFGLLLLVGLIAGAGVWTWLRGMQSDRPAGQQLQVYSRLPNATLTERTGKSVSFNDLRGTIWVADFIFTRCGGTCQVMSAKMRDLQKSLQKAGNVKLVSITVDPDYDTPDRLSSFADLYQADGDRWLFLTGGQQQIQRLATEAFKLPLQEGTDPKEPIIHSTRFVLVDGDGNIRGYYNGLENEATQKLVVDVGTLLRENG